MGQYINKLPNGKVLSVKNKANQIIENIPGTLQVPPPYEFVDNLVCVVDNGMFEAAAYCYSENEFHEFKRTDGRPKTWLIVPGVENIAQ
jgi:hypothetical protein